MYRENRQKWRLRTWRGELEATFRFKNRPLQSGWLTSLMAAKSPALDTLHILRGVRLVARISNAQREGWTGHTISFIRMESVIWYRNEFSFRFLEVFLFNELARNSTHSWRDQHPLISFFSSEWLLLFHKTQSYHTVREWAIFYNINRLFGVEYLKSNSSFQYKSVPFFASRIKKISIFIL